jgi:response regulator RpfG family c-di-GMP phosphodiesterase
MTDKKYNILWIDDEHEKLVGFKLQARQKGIILTAFKSKDAGIAELQVNYSSYDAILLDAKFFENE